MSPSRKASNLLAVLTALRTVDSRQLLTMGAGFGSTTTVSAPRLGNSCWFSISGAFPVLRERSFAGAREPGGCDCWCRMLGGT